MSNSIPSKWEQTLKDLHSRFPRKIAHEIVTEDGVFRLDKPEEELIEVVDVEDVIEIVDDSELIELVEGKEYETTEPRSIGSTPPARKGVQKKVAAEAGE